MGNPYWPLLWTWIMMDVNGDVCFWASVLGWKSIIRLWFYSLSQSSGAVWKSRWPSWVPVPNKPTVSVDVKQLSAKNQFKSSRCWEPVAVNGSALLKFLIGQTIALRVSHTAMNWAFLVYASLFILLHFFFKSSPDYTKCRVFWTVNETFYLWLNDSYFAVIKFPLLPG